MAISTENYLEQKVTIFQQEAKAFYRSVIERSFTSESRALEAFNRIQFLFSSLESEISNHLKRFDDGHGGIAPDRIDPYFQTTELHHRITSSFRDILRTYNSTYTSRPATAEIAPLRDHTPKSLLFYYSGKGELFIHGRGLATLNAHGLKKDLSWEDRIPLRPVADNLWEITVYIPPGQTAECKISNSYCWSQGPNLTLEANTTTSLQTPIFAQETPICLPIRISPGYKLSIFGEGMVQLPSGDIKRLSWDAGHDMTCMGSALWQADLIPQGDVSYKFCLISPTNEVHWEKGENRSLVAGRTIAQLPHFELSKEVQIKTLSLEEIKRERLNRNILDERAAIAIAEREAALESVNNIFYGPSDILEEHVAVEFAGLDGTPILSEDIKPGDIIKARAADGKWVLYQQDDEGCTAGASAFLMMDLGIAPDPETLIKRRGAEVEIVAEDLLRQGIQSKEIKLPLRRAPTIEELRKFIELDGSIMVTIAAEEEDSLHAIVVDEISADLQRVRLRDPAFAMDITIKAELLQKLINLAGAEYARDAIPYKLYQVDRSKT